MSAVSVIITDCGKAKFEEFISHVGLNNAVCECESEDGDVLCLVQEEKLEQLFHELEHEAQKGWSESAEEVALEFDSAFFPKSVTEFMPMRQLRGPLAARLQTKKKSLLPAYATPGYVFGTAKKS